MQLIHKDFGCFVPCHKCIDNQINTFAGIGLRLECNEVMKTRNYHLETGKAIITKGYNLPSKNVIHTVGPIIYDFVTEEKKKELSECYINSLKLTIENNIRTIAFPCISTGEFRFPKELACKIAIQTVDMFLTNNKGKIEKVILMFMERRITKYMNNKLDKIERMKKLIKDADYILIGAGAGLSTSAGIEYTGKRFTNSFADFIEKYHFTDMYSSGFYDFETEEEKWAYWAKHMYMNCIGMDATKLYKDLFEIVKDKDYFVITTNVDEQFYKSGFDKEKVFATQGSYRYIQCSQTCHNKIYDATELVRKMINEIKDCKIPTKLVPVCPVCGEKMETNLRKDAYFVQDENWYRQNEKYDKFIENARDKKVVLLELGVGFNTPAIIRLPFEQMVYQNSNWNLVRINKDNCMKFLDIEDKYVGMESDINETVKLLLDN